MISVCVYFLAGSLVLAQAPGEAPVPSDPVFRALLIDGKGMSGRLRQLGPDGALVLDGPEGGTVPLEQVVRLARDGEPPAWPPEGPLVLLPEGDRLRAIPGATNDTDLEVLPGALGDRPTRIPLESLLGVILATPSQSEAVEPLLHRVRHEPRDGEVLWLANGDRLAGSLIGVGAESVEFEPGTGRLAIPRGSVVAIGFDPRLARYPRPEGVYVELTFTDGSRLGVVPARIEKGRLVGTTRFGREIRPALANLARVHVRGPRLEYLSERAEAGAEYVGYLGRHPGRYGRDLTWDGHSLRLAGEPFDRGLGALPRTLLAYRLGERDRRFQATVGLDDRAGEKASVVFRVLVDGKERWSSPALGRRDRPVDVDVDVSGGKILILATEFGERGDVQDSADWIEARLIR